MKKNLFLPLILFSVVILNANPKKKAADKHIGMVFVKGGSFLMGDQFKSGLRKVGNKDAQLVHRVKLSSFWMGKYEVTEAEYLRVMGMKPAFCKLIRVPATKVSWYDAVKYCNRRSRAERLNPCYTIDGKNIKCDFQENGYRLPTEAEWEYAARERGRKVRLGNGKNIANPAEINFDGSSPLKQSYSVVGVYRNKSIAVGQFAPNALGLYDMSGNVAEWCWDWYGKKYYDNSPLKNPQGVFSSPHRVLRGGSWFSSAVDLQAASRSYNFPYRKFVFIVVTRS